MTCTICEICIQKFSVSGSMERRSIHYQDLPGYLYVIEASDAEAFRNSCSGKNLCKGASLVLSETLYMQCVQEDMVRCGAP